MPNTNILTSIEHAQDSGYPILGRNSDNTAVKWLSCNDITDNSSTVSNIKNQVTALEDTVDNITSSLQTKASKSEINNLLDIPEGEYITKFAKSQKSMFGSEDVDIDIYNDYTGSFFQMMLSGSLSGTHKNAITQVGNVKFFSFTLDYDPDALSDTQLIYDTVTSNYHNYYFDVSSILNVSSADFLCLQASVQGQIKGVHKSEADTSRRFVEIVNPRICLVKINNVDTPCIQFSFFIPEGSSACLYYNRSTGEGSYITFSGFYIDSQYPANN